MEMVLELLTVCIADTSFFRFNPSSNGNGAGILAGQLNQVRLPSFNPSSNGNGAGIL